MPESTRSSPPAPSHLWVTILAGGSGTRFWPLSTPARPKQLLALTGDRPLILETVHRARALVEADRIRILAGAHLLDPFRKALGEVDEGCFMLEPEPRGTGPVLAWAAWAIHRSDPDAVLISLHADHDIRPLSSFQELMRAGAEAAKAHDCLFTVAVPPDRPETGYGYIRPGETLASGRPPERRGDPSAEGSGPSREEPYLFRVRSFVEKPDRETAQRYVKEGYLWNSGIFLWKASLFLEEVRRVAPEIGDRIPLLEKGDVEAFFREVPAISVDEAVLERSSRVASLRATFQWDDVGSWEALARTQELDPSGNVLLGSAHVVEGGRNIVVAEDGTVVLFGVQGLAVVRSGNVVLVADRQRTPDLKTLLQELPDHLRDPS